MTWSEQLLVPLLATHPRPISSEMASLCLSWKELSGETLSHPTQGSSQSKSPGWSTVLGVT